MVPYHRHYVHTCPLSSADPHFGCCGAMVASTPAASTRHGAPASLSFAHVGRECAYSIVDSSIPLLLGGLLVRAIVAARGSPGLVEPHATVVSRDLICLLAAEWHLDIVANPWQPTLSPAAVFHGWPSAAAPASPSAGATRSASRARPRPRACGGRNGDPYGSHGPSRRCRTRRV